MEILLTDCGENEHLVIEFSPRRYGPEKRVTLTRTEAGILHTMLGEWLEETEGPAAGRGDDEADGRESCHAQPW